MEPGAKLTLTIGLLGLALVLSAKFLWPLVAPFVVGFFLASLIEPAVSWCERRWSCPRWLAAGGILAAVLLVCGALLAWVGLEFWLSLRHFTLDLMRAEALQEFGRNLQRAGHGLQLLPAPLRGMIAQALAKAPAQLGAALGGILAGAGQLSSWLLLLFLGVLAAYFFCRDRERSGRFLLSLVPREWRARALGMKDEILGALTGFLRAQVLLLGLTFGLGTCGLIVVGIRHALLLGFLLAVLDFLPLVGPGALLLPWAGLCLVRGGWAQGLGLIGLFALLAVVRQAAEAQLISKNLGLHPLATLASIYIGTRLFGAGGFLIGPIILVMLRALQNALALAGVEQTISGAHAKEGQHEATRDPRFNRFHRAAGP